MVEKALIWGVARAKAHPGVLLGPNQMCAPGEHPGVGGGSQMPSLEAEK